MESKDSILNKSSDPEECKKNDSNKNVDGDLHLFLPKSIVDEISEQKVEQVPKNEKIQTKRKMVKI